MAGIRFSWLFLIRLASRIGVAVTNTTGTNTRPGGLIGAITNTSFTTQLPGQPQIKCSLTIGSKFQLSCKVFSF